MPWGLNRLWDQRATFGLATWRLVPQTKTTVNEYEWAVCERHRAAIWLVGEEGPVYSEFSVDT